MSFTTPLALVLLLIIPVIIYIGWPRQRFRRLRDITSLILRTVIVLLLVLVLAGVQVVRAVDKLAVIFLVDVSDSMGAEIRDDQLDYILEAVRDKPLEDEWGIVVFGANASTEKSLTNLTDVPDEITSTVVTTHTNIAGAIDVAIGMFPADATWRIVILSDGQQTLGNADSRAQLAAASGIEISYVYLAQEPAADVRVIDLDAPSRVTEGQEFDITVTVEAEAPTNATLRIFSGGAIIHEEAVTLRAGNNSYTLTQISDVSGFLDFSAQIDVAADDDSFSQNNQLSAFSRVIGPPRVLVVATNDDDTEYLLPALQEVGMTVDVIDPENIPLSTTGLLAYKSIILVNIPASRLSNPQMILIDEYVSRLGGGLVFVGGPDSYGPGGYFETVMEQTLPLEMQIKDQQRIPQLTIVYLIDSSGSMAAVGNSGVPNIELAKEAIIRSINFLQPTDRSGVATFDNRGAWVAEIQDIDDKKGLQRQIATLRPGGGTDILVGMRLVRDSIIEEEAERKHIVLLTDGGASPYGLVDLSEELFNTYDVTVSVIAMGRGPASFLSDMAEAGNGNFHRVATIEQIPNIFAQETVLATRSYIIEDEFVPVQSGLSPILDGITSVPPLRGYVAAEPKTAAQVILRSSGQFEDPVLAAWQYGLGRVVAFTSDATGRWASDWVQWDDFPRFWSQTVNWTITEGASSELETRVVLEDNRARIIVDARDENGAFLNGLDLQTSLIKPGRDQELVPLQQVAPGRYEATFIPDDEGAYYLAVNGSGVVNGETVEFNEVNGWVMSYSPEYNTSVEASDRLLVSMAELTGGQSLAAEPDDAFAHTLDVRTATAPIWPWLLLVAIILLPVDIAVRRLIITRSDLQRARAALFGQPVGTEAQAERISTLMGARERARRRTEVEAVTASTIDALKSSKESREADSEKQSVSPPVSQGPRYRGPSVAAPPKTDTDSNIGARLLKRRRRDEAEDGD